MNRSRHSYCLSIAIHTAVVGDAVANCVVRRTMNFWCVVASWKQKISTDRWFLEYASSDEIQATVVRSAVTSVSARDAKFSGNGAFFFVSLLIDDFSGRGFRLSRRLISAARNF